MSVLRAVRQKEKLEAYQELRRTENNPKNSEEAAAKAKRRVEKGKVRPAAKAKAKGRWYFRQNHIHILNLT